MAFTKEEAQQEEPGSGAGSLPRLKCIGRTIKTKLQMTLDSDWSSLGLNAVAKTDADRTADAKTGCSTLAASVHSGIALAPGNKMKKKCIVPKVLERYNRTPGCETLGSNSEHYRAWLEKLTIEVGNALQENDMKEITKEDVQLVYIQDLLKQRDAGYDMVWLDEGHDDKVMSRLVAKQFDIEGPRDDIFAATPEPFFMRFLFTHAAADHYRVIVVIDIKCTSSGRNAPTSRMIEAYVAYRRPGAADPEGDLCIFWHPKYDFNFEQHGDEFPGSSQRDHAFTIKGQFEHDFYRKKVKIVSDHKDDVKVTNFLEQKVKESEHGYHWDLCPAEVLW